MQIDDCADWLFIEVNGMYLNSPQTYADGFAEVAEVNSSVVRSYAVMFAKLGNLPLFIATVNSFDIHQLKALTVSLFNVNRALQILSFSRRGDTN